MLSLQRRQFLKSCRGSLMGTLATISGISFNTQTIAAQNSQTNPSVTPANKTTPINENWWMPDESELHLRTWMAFGASTSIWGNKLLPEVRRNLITIAHTIAEFEPVDILVRPKERKMLHNLIGSDSQITLHEFTIDDLWMRDTGAVFVKPAGSQTDNNNSQANNNKAAVNFNFNGWGNKQYHQNDRKVASHIAKLANVPEIETFLVSEGGCIEVNGQGLAILTESCTLNHNRNPQITRSEFADEIKRLLGIDKIIWLPGIKGKDITDGHTDFYARFSDPTTILVGIESDTEFYDHAITQKHWNILQQTTNLTDKPLKTLPLVAPTQLNSDYLNNDFAAGYVGYYLCNDAIIMQTFGDSKADAKASETLQQAFPDRHLRQIRIDGIAAGGGSIHCATQQEPV